MTVKITGPGVSDDRRGAGVASGMRSHAEGSGKITQLYARDAHAEGEGTATGGSAHAEGSGFASGTYAHAEGEGASASGRASHAEAKGTAAGEGSHAEGDTTVAGGTWSHTQGSWSNAPRNCQHAIASGRIGSIGDAQACQLVQFGVTTDGTTTQINAGGAGNPNTGWALNITPRNAMAFRITLAAKRQDVHGDACMWTFDGLINRDATPANPAIITGPISGRQGTAGSDLWVAALAVNSTDANNNYLVIRVTGEAGKTIRWVANLTWVEIGG